jgi:hypothetical protein
MERDPAFLYSCRQSIKGNPMPEQALDLIVALSDDVDEDELERLTLQLREEIAELDVESVGLVPGAEAPRGAKGDPITIGSLIVSLASAGVFTGLIELVKAWALRREGRTVTFKAKLPDREVDLTYSPAGTSPEEMSRFANAIVSTLQRGEARAVRK